MEFVDELSGVPDTIALSNGLLKNLSQELQGLKPLKKTERLCRG